MATFPALAHLHGVEQPYTAVYLAARVAVVCLRHGSPMALDLGCGNGTLCRALADAGVAVVVVGPSPSGIECARKLVPEGTFYELGVEADPASVPEASFDAVVSTEVIEHLPQPALLLWFAAAKLRPGGILVLSTPYHGYLKNPLISLFGRWDTHHGPLWDGGHIKFWSRGTLTQLLLDNGFEVLEFHGAGRLPFLWKSMVLVGRPVRARGAAHEAHE